MRPIREISILSFALALVACADENSVVGGACAQGYVQSGSTCVLATSVTGDGGTQPSGDGGTNPGDDGGPSTFVDGDTRDASTTPPNATLDPPCTLPDLMCSGVCLDPTSDPNNCGACGKVCPSNICVAGKCEGAAPGHVVVVGHDYEEAPSTFSSQARVLSNATLIPASNPLRVLSYEEFADAKAVGNAESVTLAEAKQLGRTVQYVASKSSTSVSSTIDISTYDVLLVHDQMNAPSGTLAQIGSTWASDGKVSTFLHAGGVVIVLTGGSGTAEMPALATNANLLTINSQSTITGSLTVLAPADAVGSGVINPYVPKANTVSLDTEANGGNIVWVVAQSGIPVVVHEVVP